MDLLNQLRSSKVEDRLNGIKTLREKEPAFWETQEAHKIIQVVISLLYLDPYDNPDFRPIVD